MQNNVLPDTLRPLSKQLKGCLKFRSTPTEGRAVTRLSTRDLPLHIAQRNRRMVMHSQSLEEGYSIPFVLRFCHYIYRPTCSPLAFDLMLRVHVNNGFALFQNHATDYLEIHQFLGVII